MRLCSILTKTWTLLVVQHKTTHHQGPAEIVPDEALHRWMTIFVKHIRPQFAHEDEGPFVRQRQRFSLHTRNHREEGDCDFQDGRDAS